MKSRLRSVILIVLAMLTLQAVAADETAQHDTIYFYKSWQQMLDMTPVAMIVDPIVQDFTSCEIYILSGIDSVDEQIVRDYIAFSYQDSIWFINSRYVKENFEGDVKRVNGFAPLYFNEKTAFLLSPRPYNVADILMGNNIDGVTEYTPDYYYIDFKNHQIHRVTHAYLSSLLEDYHDLLVRYEGMKNYKKSEIIEDYFFKYIDRATEDIRRPYIVDLVE